MKLTRTNRPCGLTIKYLSRESKNRLHTTLLHEPRYIPLRSESNRENLKVKFPGDLSEGATPVPIPNTAVKPFSPDGTSRETSWESRTLPGINFEAQDSFLSFSFLR